MNTRIVQIQEENMDRQALQEAGEIIKAGGLVAFPTETVYGLGGDALKASSSKKIYEAKGRPSDNPLIVHIAELKALYQIVKEVPPVAEVLAGRYWPGPLTMIFEKAGCVPLETTGGLATVAVRMPSSKIARALIKAAGGYVAAPSANRSGRPSPTAARDVIEDLGGRVDMVIDGGEADIGLESTIIDLTGKIPMILRPGYITEEMLREAVGNVGKDGAIMDENTPPKAPGMKYRHYAPRGSLTVVEGEQRQRAAYINQQLEGHRCQGQKTGVVATDETKADYQADSVKSLGKRQKEEEAARHLVRILREFDQEGVEVIYAESFQRRGIGEAVMNRLLKAAGHQIIRL